MKKATETDSKNKLFASMNANQRRVAIAKDVLERIDHRAYKPTSCVYVEAEKLINEKKLNKDFINQDLSSVLLEKPVRCEVCARGAFFLSSIYKFNKIKIKELDLPVDFGPGGDLDVPEVYDNIQLSHTDIEDHERRFFSREQSELIEEMFEIDQHELESSLTYTQVRAAKAYGEEYRTERQRLIAICKNIIRNKGQFVIPKKFFNFKD